MTAFAALVVCLAQAVVPVPRPSPARPPAPVSADSPASVPSAAPRPAARRAAPPALEAMQQDPRYRYDRPVAEQPSLLDRFQEWLVRRVLIPLFTFSSTRQGTALWLVVAVLVLGAVALRLTQGGLGGLFGRRDRHLPAEADPLLGVDDIATVDLPALLAAAVASGEWRAAVRLRYLVALQRLAALGLVAWSPDKTNRAFVREATDRGGAETGRAFGDVTRAFETVWYGGAPVDAARWARVAARYERLDAALADRPARRAAAA